jgi:hypothetical protein
MGRTRVWRLRRIATRYVDPVLRPVAGRLPGFGLVTDPELRPAPPPVRLIERTLAGVTQYLRMGEVSSTCPAESPRFCSAGRFIRPGMGRA